MTNNIRKAEARLKEAFGDDKFNQFKNRQNKIVEEHRKTQIKIRQEMFQSMNRVTEKHLKNLDF